MVISFLGDLLFGGLIALLLRKFFKFWSTLDEPTKKIIIEAVVTAFKDILRAFYRWWKNQR